MLLDHKKVIDSVGAIFCFPFLSLDTSVFCYTRNDTPCSSAATLKVCQILKKTIVRALLSCIIQTKDIKIKKQTICAEDYTCHGIQFYKVYII